MDVDPEHLLLLLFTLLLIVLNGLCVAATISLLRARSSRIKELAEDDNASAKLAIDALKQLDAYLAVTQVGIILASLALGWICGPLVVRFLAAPLLRSFGMTSHATLFTPATYAIAFALLASVTLIFGALAPQAVALHRAEGTLLRLAWPLAVLRWLLRPFALVLGGIAHALLRVAGVTTLADHHPAHSEEELREIISASGTDNGGTLRETQAELLDNVMDFSRRLARQVMTHRTEILALDVENALADNVRLAQEGGRSRYPVVQGDIDTVIGFVHTKDLFALYQQAPDGDIRAILRANLVVPDTIRGDQLLRQMQRKRQHMAVLVDEYGGTAGLVTVSDLLEELVGAWPDEFEPQEDEWLTRLDDCTWTVDGRLPLVDLEEAVGRDLPCDEACDTVGGYAFWLFGRIPAVQDSVEADGLALKVTAMDSRRVSRVEVCLFATDEEEHEAGKLLANGH